MDYLLDILFPPRCVICGEIIRLDKQRWICNNCSEFLKYINGFTCIKCGIPVNNVNKICYRCQKKGLINYKNFVLFPYDEISSSIIKGKYYNHPYYFRGFGYLMYKYFIDNINEEIDYIIPVPIHKKRRKIRGFNQSEILAKEISKYTKIPMFNNLLIRIKNTKPQSQIKNIKSRHNNLKDAFIFNNKFSINAKTIMLIDDIYTTGTTIEACCDILVKNGARKVYSFCLSIVIRKENPL